MDGRCFVGLSPRVVDAALEKMLRLLVRLWWDFVILYEKYLTSS